MAQTKIKLIGDGAIVKYFTVEDTVVADGETLTVPANKKILVLGDLDVEPGGTVDVGVGATIITFENITIEQ
jgi:hypothetical protein